MTEPVRVDGAMSAGDTVIRFGGDLVLVSDGEGLEAIKEAADLANYSLDGETDLKAVDFDGKEFTIRFRRRPE